MEKKEDRRKQLLNTVLIVLVGQVGCVTLLVVLASVFGGMWLDERFGTRPLFTLALLMGGIPFSVLLMITLARRATRKIRAEADPDGSDRHSA
jgi:cation transporter-like permease